MGIKNYQISKIKYLITLLSKTLEIITFVGYVFLPEKKHQLMSFFSFQRFDLFIFRERGREGEGEGEKHQCVRKTLIRCLFHCPTWNQAAPKDMPWPGIKPATFSFAEGQDTQPIEHTSQEGWVGSNFNLARAVQNTRSPILSGKHAEQREMKSRHAHMLS